MNRFLFVFIILLTILEARENPFFPSAGEQGFIQTSNENITLPPLKRATMKLPTTTRVIESVTVNYRNLDGSQDEKTIFLENSIDWHLPLFITQSYTVQNTNIKKSENFKQIAFIKYAKYFESNKLFKILTKDKLVRDFLLVKPHRIVLDFEKDVKLKSYTKNNPKSIFKKIRIGNHDGFYRVVIELDGYYRYKYEKINDGYLLTLR